MVRINFADNEIEVKIVYYGPGLSGKTTNLQSLHTIASDLVTTELFSVKTKEDRTLFFDLMPIEFTLKNSVIKFKVYTVPGQVQYDSTRRIVLSGADAVVFVADSRNEMELGNVESFENLKLNLMKNKIDLTTTPLVLQYNKRDLPNVLKVEKLNSLLNKNSYDYFCSSAINSVGVLETFEKIVKLTVGNVFPKHKITKNVWEVEHMIDQIEQMLKPLYSSLNKKIITSNNVGLVYENVDIHSNLTETLLENAIRATDETALLYGEVNALKNKLEKRNLQLNSLLKENRYIKQFLESILNQSGVPIAVCNFTGKIVNWNREIVEIIGISIMNAKNMLFSDILENKSKTNFYKIIEHIRQIQKPVKSKLTFINRNEKQIESEVTISPLINKESEVIAFSIFIFIEKNKIVEETLPFHNEKINQLIGSVSEKLNFINEQLAKEKKFSILTDFIDNAIKNVDELKAIGNVSKYNEAQNNSSYDMDTNGKHEDCELDLLLENKRILIASDSRILLNSILKNFIKAQVTEVIDKSELVRLINVDEFSFILYDFNFPGLNGEQLHKWLSFEKPYILSSIVFLLSSDFNHDILNFMEENELNYIIKPVDNKKIIHSFNKVVTGF